MAAFEYQLVWQDAPGGAMRVYSLEGEVLRIGRSSRCDLVVLHPEVSRFHARLEWRENAYWIEDLSSTNGTWLNGRRLSPHEPVALRPGDVIGLGPNVLLHYQVLEPGLEATRAVAAQSEPAVPAQDDEEEMNEEAIWGSPPWVAEAEDAARDAAAEPAAPAQDEAAAEPAQDAANAHAADAADAAEEVPWDPAGLFTAADAEDAAPAPDADAAPPAADDIPSWVQDLDTDDEDADLEMAWSPPDAAAGMAPPEGLLPAEAAESGAAPPAPRATPPRPAPAPPATEETEAEPVAAARSPWRYVLTGCALGAVLAACGATAFLWWVDANQLWCDFFAWVPGLACP